MKGSPPERDAISVVIPAYNEEARLPGRIDEIIAYLKHEKYDYEIIVVDDGSTDSTARIVSGYMRDNNRIRLLRNNLNQGKGYSVKRGMLAAKKKYVLFTDSDRSTPMDQLPKLWHRIDSYDIVIGSRALRESDVRIKQPFYKVIFGKAGNLLIRVVATPGLRDTQCGFKLFNRRAISVFGRQTINRWGFDFEILFIARKYGMRIIEIPVTWINDERTKLKLTDYFGTLLDLFKLRVNEIRGRYG